MEFGLREVLIGVALLVIAAILIDGFRRMRRSKVGSLDLPAEMGGSMDDDWEYYKGELPNGGARAISLRKEPNIDDGDDYEVSPKKEPSFDEPSLGSAGESNDSDEAYIDESLYADGDDRFEPQVSGERVSAKREVNEPDAFEEPKQAQDEYDNASVEDYVNESLGVPPAESEGYEEVQTDLFEDDEMLARAKAEQERKLASHYRGESKSARRQEKARKVVEKQPEPAPAEPEDDDINLGVSELADVIVINVMAKPGEEIYGEDLHKAMASCGFHHGDMDIFHRYEQHNGQGRLMFSVANVVEPGTFDPTKMAEFTTPGICMFLKLPGPKRPLQAFDVLLDSARRISKLIGADMKDENHCVMTQQTFEHYRQRVVEFERKQQLNQRALAR